MEIDNLNDKPDSYKKDFIKYLKMVFIDKYYKSTSYLDSCFIAFYHALNNKGVILSTEYDAYEYEIYYRLTLKEDLKMMRAEKQLEPFDFSFLEIDELFRFLFTSQRDKRLQNDSSTKVDSKYIYDYLTESLTNVFQLENNLDYQKEIIEYLNSN